MKTIKDLKGSMPQTGTLKWIGIRPVKRQDVKAMSAITITAEVGIEGDHYSKEGGKRMVTLIQEEHLTAVSGILKKEIHPTLLRRNLVVSGINLLALHDVEFKIGEDLRLRGTGHCHPCSRMEENLGPGGYNAMRGHGGITAVVLKGGKIKVGDRVELHGEIR